MSDLPKVLAKQATWTEMVDDICRGNQDAAVFLNAWCAFCHTLDDLVDADKPMLTPEMAVRNLVCFILQVSRNPFYQGNRGQFEGLITASAMAWLDANRLKGRPESVCLKEYYFEVYFHAALLLGGWTHAREMTAKYREYDFPEPKA